MNVEERIERVLELSRRLDEAQDNDEALDIIADISKECVGLPALRGYGLADATGEVLCAALDEPQARRIQNALLLRGVVAAVVSGEFEVVDFVHQAVKPGTAAQRLIEEC
jgi:hypothetical protein